MAYSQGQTASIDWPLQEHKGLVCSHYRWQLWRACLAAELPMESVEAFDETMSQPNFLINSFLFPFLPFSPIPQLLILREIPKKASILNLYLKNLLPGEPKVYRLVLAMLWEHRCWDGRQEVYHPSVSWQWWFHHWVEYEYIPCTSEGP